LKSNLDQEISATFATFTERSSVKELICDDVAAKAYVRDPNVPDLLATNAPTKDITYLDAYKSGRIILQDKASCFPAHLLLNSRPSLSASSEKTCDGDFLDACAAPGNKTSHIASVLAAQTKASKDSSQPKTAIYACERDARRSETLQSMLDRAGAGRAVKVLAKQDFLALDPHDRRFKKVTHLLLDPSCSGSGILRREDVPTLVLPKDPRKRQAGGSSAPADEVAGSGVKIGARKRKRSDSAHADTENPGSSAPQIIPDIDAERLRKLSNLQTRIIEHAFTFPSAKVVTYSTCSIYAIENEIVALRALNSEIAKRRGWRVLKRDEQPDGLRVWPHRGDSMYEEAKEGIVKEIGSAMKGKARGEFREACIRFIPGGADGTMGFFVVGFVRDPETAEDLNCDTTARSDSKNNEQQDEGDEWQGFSGNDEDD
jgi:25S rRNA (cytosine2278-C5)-methyltransferase